MQRIAPGHSIVFVTMCIGLAALSAGGAGLPSDPRMVAVLGGAILLLGIPHGALDLLLARRLGLWGSGGGGFFSFHALYIAAAAVSAALFFVWPALALALFLLVAIWHFADDWEGLPKVLRLGAASIVVLGPVISSPVEVTEIFSAVTGRFIPPPQEVPYIIIMIAAWLFAACVTMVFTVDRRAGAELCGVALISVTLPPLLFFLAYFVLLHGPRHMIRHGALMADRGSLRWLSAYSAAAAGGLLLVVWAYHALGPVSLDISTMKVVFIGLAALTVPHVLLLEMWKRPARARQYAA